MTHVRFAIPKGSLEKKTADFLDRANMRPTGYAEGSRSYRPELDIPGLTVKVLRPQEIPYMIAAGFYDMGISGIDWYRESECESNVEDVLDLGFGRVDIVLAVPDKWEDVQSTADLFHKFVDSTGTHPLRIWTEYLNLTASLIRQHTRSRAFAVQPIRPAARGAPQLVAGRDLPLLRGHRIETA